MQLEAVVSEVKSCKIDDLETLVSCLSPMTAIVESMCALPVQNYFDMAHLMVRSLYVRNLND